MAFPPQKAGTRRTADHFVNENPEPLNAENRSHHLGAAVAK